MLILNIAEFKFSLQDFYFLLREKEINRTGELPLPESNPADLTSLLRFLFTLDCVNCEIFFSVPKLKMLIMVERYFLRN